MILEVKNLNVYIKASHISAMWRSKWERGRWSVSSGEMGGENHLLRAIMGFLKPRRAASSSKGRD